VRVNELKCETVSVCSEEKRVKRAVMGGYGACEKEKWKVREYELPVCE
jgi:hypothetical protein